jgi:regulator of sigma E protease
MAYVKMLGEEEETDSEQAFSNKPKYARALTAISGPFANLLLAAVLLTAYFSIQG